MVGEEDGPARLLEGMNLQETGSIPLLWALLQSIKTQISPWHQRWELFGTHLPAVREICSSGAWLDSTQEDFSLPIIGPTYRRTIRIVEMLSRQGVVNADQDFFRVLFRGQKSANDRQLGCG